MTVTYLWAGRMTHNSFRVKAKTTSGLTARLAVATNSSMTSPTFFGPVSSSQSMVTLDATGLTADTRYWYQVEDNGVLDTSKTGKVHTFGTPGLPYSFTFAAYACAGGSPVVYPGNSGALASTRISNHPGFLDIDAADPQLLIHMGDRSYYNLGGGGFGITGGQSLTNCRHVIDDIHQFCPNQATAERNRAVVYQYDDHDYGDNDSDGSNPTKDNIATVWRERTPDYAPASPGTAGDMGSYRSFQVGRVFFIVTDGRYYRDPPTAAAPRTYLGAGQMSWLDSTLATAAANTGIKALCWVSPQPSSSGGTTSWGSYPEARDAAYAMFDAHGFTNRMFEIAGDQHQLGFDTGTHTGGFPLYTLASMDSDSGGAGGGYDLGTYVDNTNRGQYGLITIEDPGGTFLRWTARGYSYHA